MSFDQELAAGLAVRKRANRYRLRQTTASAQDVRIALDGESVLNFCSNDYLGLANHPTIKEAATSALGKFGVGSGASHLICGHSFEHHALEQELAAFTGRDRALLFSTGYMANLGVLQALLNRGDLVLQDKLNHASLLDGAQLSRAKLKRYHHANIDHLQTLLEQASLTSQRVAVSQAQPRKLIVTDGVFSMDGDVAPLPQLVEVAKKYHSVLMVDDAHGFGCLGASGGGVQEVMNLPQTELPILMGTLGKAFGCFGAFVAGSDNLIETLIQEARSYIYTTAMPPAVAAAARASLRLVQAESWRRDRLTSLIQLFRSHCEQAGISLMPSNTPIQPILVGDEGDALALSAYLKSKHIWVTAIRPPTVPEGSSRLRVTLSAAHTERDILLLVDALLEAYKELNIETVPINPPDDGGRG